MGGVSDNACAYMPEASSLNHPPHDNPAYLGLAYTEYGSGPDSRPLAHMQHT